MGLLIKIITVGGSFVLADWLLQGISVDSFFTACLAACILMVLNLVVKPILIILTLPITFLTLGLFLLVINALTYWWTASWVDGFYVADFESAFWGSLITTIVSTLVLSSND